MELTLESFREHHGRSFAVSCDGSEPVDLELVEVTDLRRPDAELPSGVRQDPFQLKFRGPEEPLLTQGMYEFSTEGRGSLHLFLVPIERENGQTFYNVVVN